MTPNSYELSQPVVELFSWLTKRQRLSSAAVLLGYLEELSTANRELEEAVQAQDSNTAVLVLRDLGSVVERVRAMSDANRDAVIAEARALRASDRPLSAVDRYTRVRRLWVRHLEPLQQLIRVHGEIQQQLDRLRSTLELGEQRFVAHGVIARGLGRSLSRLARMRRAVSENHHAAILEIAPLYERLQRDSQWARGAARALRRVSAEGLASLAIDQLMGLTGWRTRSLMSDVELRGRLLALSSYEPPPPSPITSLPPLPALPLISRGAIREAVLAATPIRDVMAFVLDQWPDHPLTAQLRAYAIIVGGDFGAVTVDENATPRRYRVATAQLEAWPLMLGKVPA